MEARRERLIYSKAYFPVPLRTLTVNEGQF